MEGVNLRLDLLDDRLGEGRALLGDDEHLAGLGDLGLGRDELLRVAQQERSEAGGVVEVDGRGLPAPELLLHQVEGRDVVELPGHGLGAGETHREKGEAVAVDEEEPLVPGSAIGHRGGPGRRRKIAFTCRGGGEEQVDGPEHVPVALAEAGGDVAAVDDGLAIDQGDDR